jgi:hypothetical protein
VERRATELESLIERIKHTKNTILEQNTNAIYQTEHGIFATVGLGYGGSEEGLIYKLQKEAGGE